MIDIKKALASVDEETREQCVRLVQKFILTHKDEYAEKARELLDKYVDQEDVQKLLELLKK